MQLRGCGTALVTPFRQDGAIDDTALRTLIAWQIESGVDFLVPCGTTGETPTLTHDEWLYVIDVAVELAAGRVPIVAGATSNSTHEAVAKAKEAAARPGVNAILTATPYYNKPTQEGQYRHFRTIAESIEKPIILYNVPGRTGANIEPATLARLAEVPNIIGVKEASGNIAQIAEICNAVPEHFLVFSGDDAITLPVIALGGAGIISVASNEIPRETAAAPGAVEFYVYENWLAGPHKIVLHRSSCGQCNSGKGRPAGHDANHARWHGPFATLSEAREASHHIPGVLIRSECKCI